MACILFRRIYVEGITTIPPVSVMCKLVYLQTTNNARHKGGGVIFIRSD